MTSHLWLRLTQDFLSRVYKSSIELRYIRHVQSNTKAYHTNLVFPYCHKYILKQEIWRPIEGNHQFFSSKVTNKKPLSIASSVEYEQIAEDTLQNLCECFEEILENSNLTEWDVNYSNGVLNVCLHNHGVYVLNKQSPNKQIWLSSPISGPKRYDYINGKWIYKHEGVSLNELLTEEITNLLKKDVNFMNCVSSGD